MITFMSTCRRHANLIKAPPISLKELNTHINGEEVMNGIIKNQPNPPILSNNPARIIDPLTGASTCALGSHKWTPYSGNFTINAAIVININTSLNPLIELLCPGSAVISN